jgi:hypothetical protein
MNGFVVIFVWLRDLRAGASAAGRCGEARTPLDPAFWQSYDGRIGRPLPTGPVGGYTL